MKLDNIIVGDSESSPESLSTIRLIDFGLCTNYLDAQGNHISFGNSEEFVGNLALSSKNAMNFNTLSRRDDLISLTYLMVYMTNGYLDFLNCIDEETDN